MTLGEFAVTDDGIIVSQVVQRYAKSGFSALTRDAIRALEAAVADLKRFTANLLDTNPETQSWGIALEFDVPRRQKRIDAVVITERLIFVLELKSSSTPGSAGRRQVEDYALELSDFHAESQSRHIVPILVPSGAAGLIDLPDEHNCPFVQDVTVASFDQLPEALQSWQDRLQPYAKDDLDFAEWLAAAYSPTPTIIEAATHLYAHHDVKEIARSEASSANLRETQEAVSRAIDYARTQHRKVACFVTGVPGAGKTLAGLNVVCSRTEQQHKAEAVFLSGNGPLVKVLGEALARDENMRETITLAESRRRSGEFVQGVHAFIDTYTDRGDAPVDHIVVFDEAQRAWNASHAFRKFQRTTSEPVAMLQIMDRHADWAVLICLVGGGQEINTGEAGLREWGRALETDFRHWDVFVSDKLLRGDDGPVGQSLYAGEPPLNVREDKSLHLSVPMRAYRGPRVAQWVDAVLDGNASEARRIRQHIEQFDIVLTRSLDTARACLRDCTHGHRRCGLVASSGAKRLRHFGITVDSRIDVAHWFLDPPEDVRSSYYLEQLATEFDIQGLELDRIGVAWDADLRFADGRWQYRRFSGSTWQTIRKDEDRIYLINKYRVLLTRAREGMVIWVPTGDPADPLSKPNYYDQTAAFLVDCGVRRYEQ